MIVSQNDYLNKIFDVHPLPFLNGFFMIVNFSIFSRSFLLLLPFPQVFLDPIRAAEHADEQIFPEIQANQQDRDFHQTVKAGRLVSTYVISLNIKET